MPQPGKADTETNDVSRGRDLRTELIKMLKPYLKTFVAVKRVKAMADALLGI
jgi:hypothetical protein